jgi:uncharacterized Zn finger protein
MATQEETTRAKERALAQGVKIYMLELGKRYVALSASRGDLAYEIVVQSQEPGDITCSCPRAVHRGVCKHIGAMLIRLEADQPPVNKHLEQDIADLYYH